MNDILRSSEHSRIVLFADPAQDFWSRDAALPLKLSIFLDLTNQRNTDAISRLISLPFLPSAGGVSYSNAEEECSKVEEVLERLFHEGVSPAEIILPVSCARHRLVILQKEDVRPYGLVLQGAA